MENVLVQNASDRWLAVGTVYSIDRSFNNKRSLHVQQCTFRNSTGRKESCSATARQVRCRRSPRVAFRKVPLHVLSIG